MPPVKNIIELRRLLAERFSGVRTLAEQPPAKAPECRPTGVPQIDEKLGGGLPKGRIIELVCPRAGAGSALILPRMAQRAYEAGQWLALIDGLDSFDPTPSEPGVLARLLWVRCQNADQALRAADLLLRDGNAPLVLLDLQINPPAQLRKVSNTAWYRLQRLLEPTATALLVITPRVMVSSAQARLWLNGTFTLDALGQTSDELLDQLKFKLQPRRALAEAAPMPVAEAEAG